VSKRVGIKLRKFGALGEKSTGGFELGKSDAVRTCLALSFIEEPSESERIANGRRRD
jgi:hypothetical protein